MGFQILLFSYKSIEGENVDVQMWDDEGRWIKGATKIDKFLKGLVQFQKL